jgi:hypothetical protein
VVVVPFLLPDQVYINLTHGFSRWRASKDRLFPVASLSSDLYLCPHVAKARLRVDTVAKHCTRSENIFIARVARPGLGIS